ncbi:MAG: hypothetical protein H6Q72_4491 [Firmicutes bacterium]|nr:hypothetical protein [Bacillota bacterium]
MGFFANDDDFCCMWKGSGFMKVWKKGLVLMLTTGVLIGMPLSTEVP